MFLSEESEKNKAFATVKKLLGLSTQYFLQLKCNNAELVGEIQLVTNFLDNRCVFVDQWMCAESTKLKDIPRLFEGFENVTGRLRVVLVENDLDIEEEILKGSFVLTSDSYIHKGKLINVTSFAEVNKYKEEFLKKCKKEELRLQIESKQKELSLLRDGKENEINFLKQKLEELK